MILFVLLSVLLSLAAAILQYRWQHKRFYSLFDKLPLTSGHWPLIGIGYKFMTNENDKILDRMIEITKSDSNGSPRRAYAGPLCFVVVDDPEQIEKLFSSRNHINKIFLYKKFIMKSGLLTDNGAKWRAHRRLIEPAFNNAIVKSFTHIFHEKAMICMNLLEKKVGQPEFKICRMWEALALDNILSTSLGMERDSQNNNNDPYLKSVMIMIKIFAAKMFTLGYQFDWVFKWTKLYQLEQEHGVNGFLKMGDTVIEEKQKNLSKLLETPSNDEFEMTKPQIFIDQLFKMNGKFTIDEIRDEVNTIIATGFETIGTTLSLTTLLLALHPDVQEKVHEELRSVFKSEDEEVTDEHLKKLVYLDMVLKESLRYWSPVPFFARCLDQDLELGGRMIPAGANIGVPIKSIHRYKKYWGEDADEFKPERFTPDIFDRVPFYAYMPFSRGPRNCVGYNYANFSLKIVLAHFFRKFKSLTTMKENELKFEFSIVMKIVQGSLVTLEKREFISNVEN